MGENMDELQKLRDATVVVRIDMETLLSLSRCASSLYFRYCRRIVSKSVLDPIYYGRALVAEAWKLSRGNSEERALFSALSKMRVLARTLDPRIIEAIRREYEGYEDYDFEKIFAAGNGYRILTEPLLSFFYCAQHKLLKPNEGKPLALCSWRLDDLCATPSSEFERETLDKKHTEAFREHFGTFDNKHTRAYGLLKFGTFDGAYEVEELGWLGNFPSGGSNIEFSYVGIDIESQLPNNQNPEILQRLPENSARRNAISRLRSIEANLAIAAIGGAGIAGLMASGAKDSPSVRAFAVTSGIGFTASFLAAFMLKNPKVANFLSKVGAIGTASAVTIALGNTVDTIMFGGVNVNVLVIGLICLMNAVVVIFGS